MRLPSFNDFSPKILGDIRAPLKIVDAANGDRDHAVREFAAQFFGGKLNKRATTNIPATLRSLELVHSDSFTLTPAARQIMSQPTPKDGAKVFANFLISQHEGLTVVEAIQNLNSRDEPVTKRSLKNELTFLGVENLSTATTDHTTLKNWLKEGSILQDAGKKIQINDARLKEVSGITSSELEELYELSPAQRIFLYQIRRICLIRGGSSFLAKEIYDECLRLHPAFFDDDQLRLKVGKPLEDAGWITFSKLATGVHGGKSGYVRATRKLLEIPLDFFEPDLTTHLPADLRSRINTPLRDIKQLLDSKNAMDRGLGLELLALRMIFELGLLPMGFRERSADTGHNEVDVLAEGKHLLFSRWLIQCKHTRSQIPISTLAREVGISMYLKAHVIMIVATADYSRPALDYAREMTKTTHLQFVLVNDEVINRYLAKGSKELLSFMLDNSSQVMEQKRNQRATSSMAETKD